MLRHQDVVILMECFDADYLEQIPSTNTQTPINNLTSRRTDGFSFLPEGFWINWLEKGSNE